MRIEVAAALTLERIIICQLRRFIRRTQMPLHIGDGLILTARLLILADAVIAVLHIGRIPSDII